VCGLCGVFNHSEHWTSVTPGTGDETRGLESAAQRQQQVLAARDVLSLYGLKLETWANRYTLSSRTGKAAVVDNLGALWAEAERLTGQACDPLDPVILAKLEAKTP